MSLISLKKQLKEVRKAISHVMLYGQKKSIGAFNERREITYPTLDELRNQEQQVLARIACITGSKTVYSRPRG